ncbi:pyroglutamyl-peptidase 1 [Sphaeramia orbicularis]|uniref:pyroglutamyl-peptidase 1 n=1 Tax=Sphaeramia orbicularis TaxID=375764 RepID=UPI00117D7841|nr:pyroglutamyl-peptidase 1-like [Sphaeramia orbicularis]
MDRSEILVVTGFGPFKEFLVNPSWKAAQGLQSLGFGERIHVYIKEIPVNYMKTQKIIEELWQTLNPKFSVHLGIARGSRGITLEQTAKNSGYKDKDVCSFCPESQCCMEGGPEKLDSVINMKAVSKCFRQAGMDVIYSRDAGRYLCDFAYYCSLYHGQGKAALIHVPSSDKLVPLLQMIIQTMLDQLEDHSD